MKKPESIDLFVSTEEEVKVDPETSAAIERGIRAADDGCSITLEQAREQMDQWLSKSSSPPAIGDLKEVMNWSLQKCPATSEHFGRALLTHLALLTDFPLLGAPVRNWLA